MGFIKYNESKYILIPRYAFQRHEHTDFVGKTIFFFKKWFLWTYQSIILINLYKHKQSQNEKKICIAVM